MSFTRLDVSLEQYEIGLSGAIPDRKDWSEPAMDRGILEFVALFSGIVFKYGGRIVHGCHPTFTPVILRQARLQAGKRLRKPVTLIMSELWAQDLRPHDIESMTDIAEFVITKKIGDGGPADVTTRNRSLSAMRRILIDAQNVMVAVGGKMHSQDGIVPGVAEEMTLAEEKAIPRFLVGGLGGFARKLAKELTPSSLNNSLSHAANATLFGTDDVSACVNILFEHLVRSKPLVESAFQPIRWNPGNRAILDHRDGTVDSAATQNILSAVAV
jgi:SLOG-like protein